MSALVACHLPSAPIGSGVVAMLWAPVSSKVTVGMVPVGTLPISSTCDAAWPGPVFGFCRSRMPLLTYRVWRVAINGPVVSVVASVPDQWPRAG